MNCPECGRPMMRVGAFDALQPIEIAHCNQSGEWWLCISQTCGDGQRNVCGERVAAI